jgi:Zn-finger domain-containing protein
MMVFAQVMKPPQEKVSEIKERLISCLNSHKITLRELQSLIGILNFACQVVWFQLSHQIKNHQGNVKYCHYLTPAERTNVKLLKFLVSEIKERIISCLNSHKITLRELQSLIGILNFACQVIVPGRTFSPKVVLDDQTLSTITVVSL